MHPDLVNFCHKIEDIITRLLSYSDKRLLPQIVIDYSLPSMGIDDVVEAFKEIPESIVNSDKTGISEDLKNKINICNLILEDSIICIDQLFYQSKYQNIQTLYINCCTIKQKLAPDFGYFVGLDSKYNLNTINRKAKAAQDRLNKIDPLLVDLENNLNWIEDSRALKEKIDKIIEDHKNCSELIKNYEEKHKKIESFEKAASDSSERANSIANGMTSKIEQEIKIYQDILTNKSKEINDFIEKTNGNIIHINNEEKQNLNNLKIQAENIINEAKLALELSTTSSLAGAFVERAEQIEKQSYIWMSGFAIGLGGIIYLGSSHFVDLVSLIKDTNVDYKNIFMRIILGLSSVGAPLWLAWFSAKQISYCFRLAEDYRFKAAVAKSYLGFSDKAQKFGGEYEKIVFGSTLSRFDEAPLRLIEKEFRVSPVSEISKYVSSIFQNTVDILKPSNQDKNKSDNANETRPPDQ